MDRAEYTKMIRAELQRLLDIEAELGASELEAYRNLGYILGISYKEPEKK